MGRIVTTYLVVLVLLSLGFFGVGAIASAAELRDPMQPPPLAMRMLRKAKLAGKAASVPPAPAKPPEKPLQLTSILYSAERKVAIIDDQMLRLGDSIQGARLVGLTRGSARLVRRGKVISLSLDNDTAAVRKKAAESKP